MIVTWIAIQCQPFPWLDQRTDVAYVACGEKAGELSLVRPMNAPSDPAIIRMLESLERAISEREASVPNLEWLRKAMPDQGTSIRLSSPQKRVVQSYDDQIRQLASKHA